MPCYHYKAIDQDGSLHNGEQDAENTWTLAQVLWQRQRLSLISSRIRYGRLELRRFCFKNTVLLELMTLCFNLYHLEKAGVALLDGLKFVLAKKTTLPLRNALADIVSKVNEGLALSQAFARHPRVFNGFFVAVIKVGESSGNLAQCLLLLENYLRAAYENRQQIKSTLRYPLMVGCVLACVITGLFVFLVPQLETLLLSTTMTLPWTTRLLLWLSHKGFSLLGELMGVISVVYVSLKVLNNISIRWVYILDRLYLKLPFIGTFVENIIWAHSFQAMAIALKAGLTIQAALNINAGLLNNRWLRLKIQRGVKRIEEGCSLTEALKETNVIPSLALSMLSIAEETNALTATFENLARYYKHQSDLIMQRLLAMLQPALIIICGGIMLWIVQGFFAPLYENSLHFEGGH